MLYSSNNALKLQWVAISRYFLTYLQILLYYYNADTPNTTIIMLLLINVHVIKQPPSPSGCWWPGQDQTSMATLLHRHSGTHIRSGLCGQGQDRRSKAGTTSHCQRQRNERCHHLNICQQTRFARWCVIDVIVCLLYMYSA